MYVFIVSFIILTISLGPVPNEGQEEEILSFAKQFLEIPENKQHLFDSRMYFFFYDILYN